MTQIARPQNKNLHLYMLIGLAAGLLIGLLINETVGSQRPWVLAVTQVTQPIGQLFLRALFMLVIPLLFSALILAVSEMSDVRALGRTGWRTLLLTVVGASIAVIIGLGLTNLIQPGLGVDPEDARKMLASAAGGAKAIVGESSGLHVGSDLVQLVPSNVIQAAAQSQYLPVMVFALLFGIGVVLTPRSVSATLRQVLEGVFHVSMTLMGLIMRIAPLAIACLAFDLAVLFGWQVVARLGSYIGVVLLALLIQVLLVYSLALRFLGRMSPLLFLRQSREALLVAFSTASSNATLPTTLLVAEEKLGLPKRISRFVLTIGAATSHHGTALFEGVTVLFLAQFFGITLTFFDQLTVMALCVFTSMGTAAVPAGSLPVVAAILALFGIPPEGIGLILGVDRLLDMCRTTVNVTADLAVAVIIARIEPPETSPTATSA